MSENPYPVPPVANPVPPTGAPAVKPDDNLVWAILSTVLCCLPFGIVAIVKSCKVDSLWAAGQYAEAKQAADEAKKWSIISAVVFGGFVLLYIIIVAVGAAVGA